MKILVHICCGPCAITPIRALIGAGMDVTGFYYNPNIHPLQEYLRRREGVAQVAGRLGIPVIYKDDEYDPKTYFRAVAFREPNRCQPCYALRLERALSVARRGGFDAFTTTLLYSKYQKHEQIMTTVPKAKELRPYTEKLITLAKRGGPMTTGALREKP